MNKELFDEICISTDSDMPRKMKLTYYLLTDHVREKYCDLMVYGAEIDKECVYDDGKIECEKKIIKDLFFQKGEAENFMRKIVRCAVTPMGLKDAVKEHIGEQIKLLSC